ncbi:DUF2829 domain-containing protein [Xenorhabdus sp. PB61.4]|uniref:Thoeris anti-defense Tad2 family protein n=1 Tax=Xenorhabdus sp. PB61.4 TaxID=2788940 RepID=UPI001E637440|nr:MW1434 family type I TA system toxin [Xenorhabdus sp. PB61.4]MCC8367991.1 DUF2829 domain-containing protein [Xenorhabdus sp. PB61.4]
MSDVNKLDDKQCPFDPDQYKAHVKVSYTIDNDIAAPVGSLPWALIQVYLGKVVGRSQWGVNEYIRLSAKNDSKTPVHIEKHDQQSFPYDWEPTPEDLMACDWELVKIKPKPVECMLSFDLEVATDTYNNGQSQDWGYLTQGANIGLGESLFGTLTNLQNTIGIGNILQFTLTEYPIGSFESIELQVDTQNQADLASKNLEVTVNGSTYNLGPGSNSTTDFYYTSDGAKQLGDLLKQNVGKTLSFCFRWK